MGKMETAKQVTDRFDPSYQEILDRDTRPVPEHFREENAPDLGTEPIAASRYTSQEFFEREAEKMWPRVWQMACREEEIPQVGDYHVYENVGKSYIIVRTKPDEIKALANVCLHRGRKLVTADGCQHKFRCPYHGFTWNIDGSFKEHPFDWDFSHLTKADLQLPEAQVGTWGGFVFINPDPEAPPLAEVLGLLPRHFARYDYAGRYKAAHVAKVVNCNWKVCAEAFMESHHTVDTHPQIMPYLSDLNSQYDVYSEYISRQISAMGVTSPHLAHEGISDQEIVNRLFIGDTRHSSDGSAGTAEDDNPFKVPDGMSARAFCAEALRKAFGDADKADYTGAADAEMLDAILYNVFPNLSVWAGYMPNLVYRWRPYGGDVNKSIMDVMILKPVPGDAKERPAPAERVFLDADQPWTDAQDQLGKGLADIFEQDMANLPFVQEGLTASMNNKVHFGRYQEMRIRMHHQTLDKYLDD